MNNGKVFTDMGSLQVNIPKPLFTEIEENNYVPIYIHNNTTLLRWSNTLRATDCNFREFADTSEIADFFIICQEKPLSKLLLKTVFKLLEEFSFLRYPAKCEKPGLGPGRPENTLKNRACWRLPGSK